MRYPDVFRWRVPVREQLRVAAFSVNEPPPFPRDIRTRDYWAVRSDILKEVVLIAEIGEPGA